MTRTRSTDNAMTLPTSYGEHGLSPHRIGPPSTARAALTKKFRAVIAVFAAAAVGLTAPSAVAASGQPTVTTTVRHIDYSEHYEGCGGLPGSIEYVSGKERYQSVVFPDGSIKISWGGTFEIYEVSDDPGVPPRDRQSTDAGVFRLSNNGPEIYHESFHDRNSGWGDIFLVTTFVVLNGEVHVDHTVARDLPPDGC